MRKPITKKLMKKYCLKRNRLWNCLKYKISQNYRNILDVRFLWRIESRVFYSLYARLKERELK